MRQNIAKAIIDLEKAQFDLIMVRMNNHRIEEVNKYIENVIRWNDLEEDMLKYKAMIDWLRLGDGNNYYFHASIKSKKNAKSTRVLYREYGTNVTTQ